MKIIIKITAFIAILIAIAGSSVAGSITISVFAKADSYARSGDGQTHNNFGGADQLLVGNHATLGDFHGVLQFDLSRLPTDIEIQSVTLQMVKPANGVGLPFLVNIYELSPANADWVEGLATWYSKGAAVWAGSAGASTAGIDYNGTVLASYRGTTAAGDAVFDSQAAFLTAVSNNLGGALNLGIGLDSGADVQYYRFATREHASADGPMLVIEYNDIP